MALPLAEDGADCSHGDAEQRSDPQMIEPAAEGVRVEEAGQFGCRGHMVRAARKFLDIGGVAHHGAVKQEGDGENRHESDPNCKEVGQPVEGVR